MPYRKHPSHETYFGQWLDDMIFDNNTNLSEIARSIGLNKQTVSNHATGRSTPTLNTIKEYAKLFGWQWTDVYDLVLMDKNLLPEPFVDYEE